MLETAVALLLAILALVALAASPRARLNRALAALLLLRAGGTLAFDRLRAAEALEQVAGLPHAILWYALPAPFLAAILLVELAPRSLGRTARRACVAAGATVSLGGAIAFSLDPTLFVAGVGPLAGGVGYGYDSGPLAYLLAGLSTLLDGLIVLVAAGGARDVASSARERRQRAALAVAFAFVPVHGSAFLVGFVLAGASLDALLVARFAPSVLALALALVGLWRARDTLEGRARLAVPVAFGALAALAFAEGLATRWSALSTLLPQPGTLPLVARAGFASVAALALVRFGLAGAGDAQRARIGRATALALGVSIAALAVGVALALLGLGTAGISASLLLGGVAIALSPVALRDVAMRAADRLLLPRADDAAVAARTRAYVAAMNASLAPDGRLLPEGERLLRDLRADLQVSERDHELLLRALASRARAPERAAGGATLLGRYRIEQELGRGAHGSVHLAVDESTGERVVVKRSHARDPSAALREARALARVRHPRVVRLREVDRVGDEVFLVMDHLPGGSARAALDREGPLAPPRALRIGLDALEGLAALHAHGLVHRDVKPENVLLDADGRAVVADLGSASVVADATLTGAGVVGTLATMAPETLTGGAATARSDVHMAAATLYRLLTGETHVDLREVDVFEARERIRFDPPRLPHPRVPLAVEPVLRRALSKRPEERHADAEELRAALEAAAV